MTECIHIVSDPHQSSLEGKSFFYADLFHVGLIALMSFCKEAGHPRKQNYLQRRKKQAIVALNPLTPGP